MRMEYTDPVGVAADQLAALQHAERERAMELQREGTLRELWRVPGRRASWSLWSVPGATALHEELASLPMWPWISATVETLARHPNRMAAAK